MVGRIRSGWAVLAISSLAWGVGCDGPGAGGGTSTVNLPPPPVSETRTVGVVLPGSGPVELEIWEQDARRHGVQTQSLVEIFRPSPDDPPTKEAELIRDAVARGISALVVLPNGDPSVVTALKEARDANVPIVLLDRDAKLDGKPVPKVAYTTEEETAQKLVAAAVEDARSLGFPADGPAQILVNGPHDDHDRERIAALHKAFEDKGVRVLPDVAFSGLIEEGRQAMARALESHPEIAIVVATENHSLVGAAKFRNKLDHKKRRFVIAGYSHEKITFDLARYNVAAGVVDRNVHEPVVRAYDAALALIRGETVPDRIEVHVPMYRATGPEKDDMIPQILADPTLDPEMKKLFRTKKGEPKNNAERGEEDRHPTSKKGQ